MDNPMSDDLYEARQTAYDWHSGQWSPLYAFASSGIIESKGALLGEIEDCFSALKRNPENFGIDELAKLDNLKQVVEDAPEDTEEDRTGRIYGKYASRTRSNGRKVAMDQQDFIQDTTKILGKPGKDPDTVNFFDDRELLRKFYSQFYEGAVLIADDGTYYQVLELVAISGNFVAMMQDVLHPQIVFTISVNDLVAHTWKWVTPFDVVVNPGLAPKQTTSVADLVSVGDLDKPEVPERWLSY